MSRSGGATRAVSQSTSTQPAGVRIVLAAWGSPWVSTMRSGCVAGRLGELVVRREVAAHRGLARRRGPRGTARRRARVSHRPSRSSSARSRSVAVAEHEVVGPGRTDDGRGVELDHEVEHGQTVLRRLERAVRGASAPRRAGTARAANRSSRRRTSPVTGAAPARRRTRARGPAAPATVAIAASSRAKPSSRVSFGVQRFASRSSTVTNHRPPSPSARQWWLPNPTGRYSTSSTARPHPAASSATIRSSVSSAGRVYTR